MGYGDKIKLNIRGVIIEAMFSQWIDEIEIEYIHNGKEWYTHYKSVVEINGRSV